MMAGSTRRSTRHSSGASAPTSTANNKAATLPRCLDGRHGLGLGGVRRAVVALEGDEDDEGQDHREAGPHHGEHPGGALGVGEAPAVRREAGQRNHRHGAGGRRADDDQRGDEEAHAP